MWNFHHWLSSSNGHEHHTALLLSSEIAWTLFLFVNSQSDNVSSSCNTRCLTLWYALDAQYSCLHLLTLSLASPCLDTGSKGARGGGGGRTSLELDKFNLGSVLQVITVAACSTGNKTLQSRVFRWVLAEAIS